MIDTPYNRRKMVHYVLGMQRVVQTLSYDDDPNMFIADTEAEIEKIKTDWAITGTDLKIAQKRMVGGH